MLEAFATGLLVGGLNTLLDFATLTLALEAHPLYAVGRIMFVCYVVGTVEGARARQLLIGAVSGLMLGALLGGEYHVLAPALGWGALLLTWGVFWLSFALLDTLLRDGKGITGALVQGAIAAALSGAVFYSIAHIWNESTPKDPNYLRLLVLWTGTFLPGFAVLFWHGD